MCSKPVIFIVGPTASGKTALAIELAKALSTEIVSVDSRQIFREMNIGTAKPTQEELSMVRHHCIDICNPADYFSAGEFGLLARSIIDDLLRHGKIPVVAGGSGLYLQALIDGIFTSNYRDPSIRKALQKTAEKHGWESLYKQLAQVDPDTAAKIHPNDHRRLIRALEVFRIAHQPISRLQAQETVPAPFAFKIWGLNWPREVLYHRIETRVDQMIAAGLEQEVRQLLNYGYSMNNNSLDSVGYKEMIAYVHGEIGLEEAINRIKRNTRRFAKRQLTWFRKDVRIRWIEMKADINLHQLSDIILQNL